MLHVHVYCYIVILYNNTDSRTSLVIEDYNDFWCIIQIELKSIKRPISQPRSILDDLLIIELKRKHQFDSWGCCQRSNIEASSDFSTKKRSSNNCETTTKVLEPFMKGLEIGESCVQGSSSQIPTADMVEERNLCCQEEGIEHFDEQFLSNGIDFLRSYFAASRKPIFWTEAAWTEGKQVDTCVFGFIRLS